MFFRVNSWIRETNTRATCMLLAVYAAATPLAAQEAASTLPATFTNPPLFWMPDAGSGWIDFSPQGNHIVIPVVLNGHPTRALIDTGVDQLIVSKAYADVHRLPLTPWAKPVGSGGPAQYYTTPSVALDVGAFRTSKPGAFTVVDLSHLTGSGLNGVDVVIGLPLLGPFEWQVDQDHHRFRLLKSGSIPVSDGIPIRVGPNNSRLVTDVSINGKSVSSMIDTGSDDEISLASEAAETTGFEPQTDIASIGMGGISVQSLGRLTDFMIGTRKVTGAYATIGGNDWWGSKEIQALVGMGVLRAYNMTLDLSARRMMLEPRLQPAAPIYRSSSGVQGFVRDGRWSIAHVMRNSPAAAASLKPGVEICAVDDKPVTQELIDGYWRQAALATQHVLKLCDGTSRTITLRSFY